MNQVLDSYRLFMCYSLLNEETKLDKNLMTIKRLL